MAHVFISYSREDGGFVRRLQESLAEQEREVWVDWEDIPPTAEFMEEIRNAIEAADAFLFVITPDSLGSEVCGKELAHAIRQNKRLIPVLRRDAGDEPMREELASRNWVLLRDSDDFGDGVRSLLSAIDTDLDWVRRHTDLLRRASVWERHDHDKSYLARGVVLSGAEQFLAEADQEKDPQPVPVQREYAFESRKRETRRLRITVGATTAALIATAVLGVLAYSQYRLSQQRLRAATARQLALESQAAGQRFPQRSVLLAIEAIRATKPDGLLLPAAEQALRDALRWLSGQRIEQRSEPSASPRNAARRGGDDEPLAVGPAGRWKVFRRRGLLLVDTAGEGAEHELIGDTRIGAYQGQELKEPKFSPDGRWLAVLAIDPTAGTGIRPSYFWLRVWNLARPSDPPTVLKGHASDIAEVVFHRRWLISVSDESILPWSVEDSRPAESPLRLSGPVGGATAVRVTENGRFLVAGFRDHAIRRWDLAAPSREPLTFWGLEAPATKLEIDSDGSRLVATSSLGETLEFQVQEDVAGVEPLVLAAGQWPVRTLATTPEGDQLFTGSVIADRDVRVRRWALGDQTITPAGELPGAIHELEHLIVSEGGRWLLATGSYLGEAHLYDLTRPESEPYRFPPTERPWNGGRFSADERWMILESIFRGPAALVRLDPTPRRILTSPGPEHGPPESEWLIGFGAAGRQLLTGRGSTLGIRDISGSDAKKAHSLAADLELEAISGEGGWLLLKDANGRRSLRQTEDPAAIVAWLGEDREEIDAVAASEDRRWAVTGRRDEEQKERSWLLWNLGEPASKPYDLGSHARLSFIDGSRHLVAWGDGPFVTLWKLDDRSLDPPWVLRGHEGRVSHLAWTADGRCLVTGAADAMIQLWNLQRPEEDAVVLRGHLAPITNLALSSDDRRLFSASSDGSVRVWRLWQPGVASHLRLGPIVDLARRVVGRELSRAERRRYVSEESVGTHTGSPPSKTPG